MKLPWLFSLVVFSSFVCKAQLSGTISVPSSNYANLQSLLSALNSQSIAANGLTVQVAAGYTESIPNGGFTLSVSGTSLHPLVIEKTGTGNKPVFIGYTGNSTPGSSVQDGLFRFIGCDHVIVDGLSFKDPNTSNPQTMEFGLGFFKGSSSNGCQFNTIKNCEITLSIHNNANGSGPAADGSRGIEFINALSSAHSSSLLIVSPSGSHAYNKIQSNTISGTNHAIVMTGFVDQSPYLNADRGNEIGGNNFLEGNLLLNFGGGGTVNASAAIKTSAQYDLVCGFNLVKNNDGNSSDHLTTLRGIQIGSATGANTSIHHNTITLTSGGTSSQVLAIENLAGTSGTNNTVTITFNVIFQCNYAEAVSGNFYGISHSGSAAHVFINNNRFRENASSAVSGSDFLISCNGTLPADLRIKNNELGFYMNGSAPFNGNLYGIYLSGATSSDSAEVSGNYFQNFSFGLTAPASLYFIYNNADFSHFSVNGNRWKSLFLNTSGTQYYIYNSSSTGSLLSVCDNTVWSTNRTAGAGNTAFYYGNATSPATAAQTFSGNSLSDIRSLPGTSGNFYGIYNTEGNVSPYPKKSFYSNKFTDIQFSTTGSVYGFYLSDLGDGGSGTPSTVYSNTLQNLSGADNVYGMYVNSPCSPTFPLQIAANRIGGIFSSGASSSAYGIYAAANNAGIEILRNKVYDVSSGGNSSVAYGLYLASVNSATVHNNLVGRIQSSGVGNSRVNGMYISGSGNYSFYFNSIYLDAVSNATHFGSNALYASTTASLTLRNNILMNLSVQSGTGICTAFRRSSTNLTSYQSASDNNLLYAGVPSASRVLMYNGSTGYQTLSAYKAAVTPRDLVSLSNTLSIQSLAGASTYFLHLPLDVTSPVESAGSVISPISNDVDMQIRQGSTGYAGTGTKPDIGADEIEINASPCSTVMPANVTNSLRICAGDSFTAQAITVSPGSGISFQWQISSSVNGSYLNVTSGTGFNGSEYFSTPVNNPGTYFYRLQSSCATNSASIASNIMTVTVLPIPTPTIVATTTNVCVSDTIKLSATGNTTTIFEWSGPEGYYDNGKVMKRWGLSKTKAGTYSLNVTEGGCAAFLTIQIHISDPDLKLFCTHDGLCAGNTATLFATSSANSYSWSTAASTASISVSPSVATLYTVGVIDSVNCFSKKDLLLTVTDPTIHGVSAVACGIPGSSTLSVKAFTPSLVNWYSAINSSVGLASGLTLPVTATTTNTFFAQANSTMAGTLSVLSSATLTSQGIMFDLVALNKIQAEAMDVLFSAVGTTSFEIWARHGTHQGSSTSSLGWGLVNSGTVSVNSTSQLTTLSMGAGLTALKGETVSFYVVTGSSNQILHAQGSLLGVTFAQNKDLKIKEGSSGAYFNCTVSPTSFYGQVKYTIPGCLSPRVPVSMTVSALPQLTLSSSVSDVCPGKTVTLSAQGASTYSWSGVGSGSVISVSLLASKIFTAIGTNAVGCKNSSTIQVNALTAPVISVSPFSSTVCPLQSVSLNASGALTYTWNTGPNGPSIQVAPVSSSVYSVQGTNSLGCVAMHTVAVTTLTTPLISIQASTTDICPGEAVQLSASGALSYTWLPTGVNSLSIQVNPIIGSVYNAIGLGVNGCTNVAFVVINVDGCVSLQEVIGSSDLEIFPNPSEGKFHIKTNEQVTLLQVQDCLGKTLVQEQFTNDSYLLDLSGLPAGVYVLRYKVNGFWFREKLIRE